MVKPVHLFVEPGVFVFRPIGAEVLFEELESLVPTDFLTGVDKWLAFGQSVAEHSHCLPGITHTLEFRARPAVFVVVGGESEH